MGGVFGFRLLGAFVIWVVKGFSGNIMDYRNNKYSSFIGFGTILLFVLILKNL